jgi:uncharacterized membrane protein YcaP (DUF421 family)
MDIVFRAFFVFVLLYVLMRAIGRRELSTLEPFDLILLVVLGDLVQQGVTQDDYSVTGIMLAIGTIALLQLGVSFVNYKFPKLRPLLDGEPIILVQDGKPIEHNMKRERVTHEDIAGAARQESIAHVSEIKWAVLETNGKLSFIKKSDS